MSIHFSLLFFFFSAGRIRLGWDYSTGCCFLLNKSIYYYFAETCEGIIHVLLFSRVKWEVSNEWCSAWGRALFYIYYVWEIWPAWRWSRHLALVDHLTRLRRPRVRCPIHHFFRLFFSRSFLPWDWTPDRSRFPPWKRSRVSLSGDQFIFFLFPYYY